MDDTITIFGIDLDVLTAKETMKRVLTYMDSETVSTVEIVTLEMLMQGQDDVRWKEQMDQIELLIPGEKEILEAVGSTDRILVRDLESQMFFKMFLKYLQRNKKRVFLLAEEEEELLFLRDSLKRYGRGLGPAGQAVLPRDSDLKEHVINEINGVEPDCIFSVLSCPWQETFITENRALLNARLWMGCGPIVHQRKHAKKNSGKFRHFVLKKIFCYRVGKEKNAQIASENKGL